MTWTELYRLASGARCELDLLDSCLAALAESNHAGLHAHVTAAVPTPETLCAVLDEHGIPTTHQVEGAIVMRHRFVEVVPTPQPPLTLGTPTPA